MLGIPNVDDLRTAAMAVVNDAIAKAGGTLTQDALPALEADLEKVLAAGVADITSTLVPALQAALTEALKPVLDPVNRAVALLERLDGMALKLELGPVKS